MATDKTLIERREELKRRLEAGEYKTLVDVFLEGIDRLIRKVTRQSKPVPIWLVTVILGLFVSLIAGVGIYATGDSTTFYHLSQMTNLRFESIVLWLLLNCILFVVSSIFIDLYMHRIFVFWLKEMLDRTESVVSLEKFEDWVMVVCNKGLHLLITMLGGLASVFFMVIPVSSLIGIFAGYGFTFVTIFVNIFAWSIFYQFFLVVMLSVMLRRYDLKLFVANPSGSELLSRLSGELSIVLYIVALFAFLVTLITALAGLLPTFGFLLVLIYWLPIIMLFILNQTSLSSIILRAKWNTLNEIQAKVEKLQSSKSFGDQETIDAINRLMDYHDRVKATRDSALDFRTYLNFINSLLIPLLAFLLGNLDIVLSLFARKP